jgi:hypothetical protein
MGASAQKMSRLRVTRQRGRAGRRVRRRQVVRLTSSRGGRGGAGPAFGKDRDVRVMCASHRDDQAQNFHLAFSPPLSASLTTSPASAAEQPVQPVDECARRASWSAATRKTTPDFFAVPSDPKKMATSYRLTISDPQKMGDGLNAYMSYKVTSQVSGGGGGKRGGPARTQRTWIPAPRTHVFTTRALALPRPPRADARQHSWR